MAIDFSAVNLTTIDIKASASPEIYIGSNHIVFSKRLLEDLGYPQYVQYCLDASHKIFAVRVCKGSEANAVSFSKPKGEQSSKLACFARNLHEPVTKMIPNYDSNIRYRVSGEYDADNRVMYFDMTTATVGRNRKNKSNDD